MVWSQKFRKSEISLDTGRHGFTSVSAVMRLFRISNAKCNHMGWKVLLGYMYLLYPAWHIWDNLSRLKLLNQLANLVLCEHCSNAVWAGMVLNSCETTFSCITYPLRHILSIFLEASKEILDVVFLYFRLLDFTTDIFALQHMSGKNNDSSKSRLACFTAKCNCALPRQTTCAVKSDYSALATFQNVWKTGKQREAIWNKREGPTLLVFS